MNIFLEKDEVVSCFMKALKNCLKENEKKNNRHYGDAKIDKKVEGWSRKVDKAGVEGWSRKVNTILKGWNRKAEKRIRK